MIFPRSLPSCPVPLVTAIIAEDTATRKMSPGAEFSATLWQRRFTDRRLAAHSSIILPGSRDLNSLNDFLVS